MKTLIAILDILIALGEAYVALCEAWAEAVALIRKAA